MLTVKLKNNPRHQIISHENTSTPSPPTRCVRNLCEQNFRGRSRGRMRCAKLWNADVWPFFRMMFWSQADVLRRESLTPRHLDFASSPLLWLFVYSRGHCLKFSEGNLLFIRSCKIKNLKCNSATLFMWLPIKTVKQFKNQNLSSSLQPIYQLLHIPPCASLAQLIAASILSQLPEDTFFQSSGGSLNSSLPNEQFGQHSFVLDAEIRTAGCSLDRSKRNSSGKHLWNLIMQLFSTSTQE